MAMYSKMNKSRSSWSQGLKSQCDLQYPKNVAHDSHFWSCCCAQLYDE